VFVHTLIRFSFTFASGTSDLEGGGGSSSATGRESEAGNNMIFTKR